MAMATAKTQVEVCCNGHSEDWLGGKARSGRGPNKPTAPPLGLTNDRPGTPPVAADT